MLKFLWIVLGILLVIIVLAIIVVLCVNARVQQLKDEKYSVLTGDEAFKTLTNDIDNYSVKELEDKAKILLAEYVLKEGTFSYKPKTTNRVAFNLTDIEDKPYGSLFDDLEP